MEGKRLVLKFINFILFFFTVYAFASLAQADDFQGFRGLNFGDPLPKEGMTFIKTVPSFGGTDIYSRDADDLNIGAAKLTFIHYYFWQDKLSFITIACSERHNFSALLAAFTEKFGEPYQENKYIEKYMWRGKNMIIVSYNKYNEIGTTSVGSGDIIDEQKNWEKEQAKKAKGDF